MGRTLLGQRSFYKANKRGELVVVPIRLPNGSIKKVRFRKYKALPKGCLTAKRLCLKCFAHIRKTDLNYESKICKKCSLVNINTLCETTSD